MLYDVLSLSQMKLFMKLTALLISGFFFFVSLNLVLSLATLTFCDFRQNWRLYLTITVINVRQKLKWKHLHSTVVLHQVAQKRTNIQRIDLWD